MVVTKECVVVGEGANCDGGCGWQQELARLVIVANNGEGDTASDNSGVGGEIYGG